MGGVNLYQYAPNPVGWVDPLGLSSGKGGCVCNADGTLKGIDLDGDGKLSEEENFAYRALTGKQAEEALAGKDITPKDSSATYSVQEHVEDGSRKTQYNSLTKDKKTADFYAAPNLKRGKTETSPILKVDLNKVNSNNVIDISSGVDPITGNTLTGKAYGWSKKDKEVLIEGNIPSSAYTIIK